MAKRSGKLVVGQFAARETLDRGAAKLLIITSDASIKTKEEFKKKAEEKNVPIITTDSKEKLGRLIGMPLCCVVVFTDNNMARGILKNLGKGRGRA